jgi:hypothetical protein
MGICTEGAIRENLDQQASDVPFVFFNPTCEMKTVTRISRSKRLLCCLTHQKQQSTWFSIQWTPELRVVWCSNNSKLEQKKSRKIRFWNLNKNSKVEQRITWSSRLVQKWHPNIAVVNRSINLFNNNVIQHFRKILNSRQKQMSLYRFLSKEDSSGGNVNEQQFSTSEFQMKEGQFTFQWTVISLLLLLLFDYYTIFLYSIFMWVLL